MYKARGLIAADSINENNLSAAVGPARGRRSPGQIRPLRQGDGPLSTPLHQLQTGAFRPHLGGQ